MNARAILPGARAVLACGSAGAQTRRITAIPDHAGRWTPFPRGVRPPPPCSQPIPRSTDPALDALAIHEGIWCAVDRAAVRALLR